MRGAAVRGQMVAMNKRVLMVVLVAGLAAGCGKKADSDKAGSGKAGGAAAGSCKDAVASSMRVVSRKLEADIDPAKLADAIKLVSDAQLAACTDDKWPAAAVACLAAAKDDAAMAGCASVMGSANQSLAGVMGKIGPQLFSMMKPKAPPADPATPPAPPADPAAPPAAPPTP